MAPDARLAALLGEWTGTEEVLATAWTTAGSARGALTIEPGPGGIIFDYVESRADGHLVAHGVVSGDGFWWFDSSGFVPDTPGSARWEDAALVLDRRSARGRTVLRLRAEGAQLAVDLDTAVPTEAALVPLVRGTYTRRAG